MPRRQPLPDKWLMTDERMADGLFAAIRRLPRGAGIVFRHYRLNRGDRHRLFLRIRTMARRRGLILLVAGPPSLSRAWGADGSHGKGTGAGLRSRSAHDLAEIRAAERCGADLIFLSPLFATRSHPGARPLGKIRFSRLARQTRLPVIALGGVDARRARHIKSLGAYGWAAIDGWMED